MGDAWRRALSSQLSWRVSYCQDFLNCALKPRHNRICDMACLRGDMSNHRMRLFSTAFKEDVVRRLESGEALAAVSKELGIARKLLYEWRWAWRRHGAAGLNRRRGPKKGLRRKMATSRSGEGRPGQLRLRPPRAPRLPSPSRVHRRRARLSPVGLASRSGPRKQPILGAEALRNSHSVKTVRSLTYGPIPVVRAAKSAKAKPVYGRLGGVLVRLALVGRQTQHRSQLGRERLPGGCPCAGSAEQPGVLQLFDVRQVAQAFEPEFPQKPRRGDIGVGRAGGRAARAGGDQVLFAQRGDRVPGNLPPQTTARARRG